MEFKNTSNQILRSCQPNFNVMQFHRCEAASGVVENYVQTVETPQDDIPSAERTICDIKNEGVSLLASLRSNNSLLSKVIPDNVNSLNQVSEMTAGYLRQQVLELVRSEPSVPSETVMKIDQELQFVEKPFDFLTIFQSILC